MIAILASFLISTNATPRQRVATCREMVPANVELSGRLVMRNRRGVSLAEHDYVLTRTNAQTRLVVDRSPYDLGKAAGNESILGTDVTASDLTLEYLWWDDVSLDSACDGETVNGQSCAVVVMRKGPRSVRVWIDRKTGALMQAEELSGEKAVRRLWGTRIKKFGERWMANVLEVETLGSGHRTKITVEDLK